jgi:DNA-binding MarR family transcriptional regulator
MHEDELTEFYLALTNLHVVTKQKLLKAAAGYGLTGIQAIVLTMLRTQDPPAMQALAATLGCDASNITGIVDALESKRLVSRQEKAGDRRVKVIKLEPEGEKVCGQILNDAAHVQEDHLAAQLSGEELRTFVGLVHKISQSIGA